MSLLDVGRSGLAQAMTAQNNSTELANQMQGERARLKLADQQAKSATAGQMLGLGGAAAITLGPKAYDSLTSSPSLLNSANASLAPAASEIGTAGANATGSMLSGSGLGLTNAGTAGAAGLADTTGTSSAISSAITPAMDSAAATAGTEAAATGGAEAAGLGLGEAAAAAIPFVGWAAAAGMLAYSLFS